ncbi:hypothetical protein BACCIP111899_02008 [Bacillus rhizoplanae]|uniref:Uncharacterized protein n=1 Tax=Bacillus rhizoplanae TaxID=2880966 RepID=A0ABM8YB08_9BACI|nr:DUF4214 domain-containing protein [Bacillus rhizoplanae]CAG9612830.1 hypothetical protein BACCIP111899_02008 [Bacillus rhizoplanae]
MSHHDQNQPTIIDMIRKIMQISNEAFVHEVYIQILHRKPLDEEEQYFSKKLTHKPKIAIIQEIMVKEEAQALYTKAIQINEARSNQAKTISYLIQSFYCFDDKQFLHSLYEQLLNRSPDSIGFQNHLNALASGFPRVQLMEQFLLSEECRQFLETPLLHPEIQTNQKPSPKIGLFIGYLGRVGKHFGGEGIGRFSIRLAESLLHHDKNATVTVAIDGLNYVDISKSFKEVSLSFPDRFSTKRFDNVKSVNATIPVDVWIVPYVGMELALQLEKPIIVCLHDLVYLHFKELYDKAYPNFCDKLHVIVSKLVTKASKVVFNSNFVRDHEGLKFMKLPSEKMHVIRLAAPVEEYSSVGSLDESTFRKKYKLNNDYIVYPSVIRPHKNHDRLIEAFLKFKQTYIDTASNLSLALTDDFQNGPKKKEIATLLNDCEDPHIRNSVVFLGRIPTSDVPFLYKHAIGTIVPTLFEGSCPFQLLESLIMDTPVAVSKLEVVEEIITDIEKFITFNPYSVDEIILAIHHLWQHNNTFLTQQQIAIEHILKRTWANVAQEYYTLLTEIFINN